MDHPLPYFNEAKMARFCSFALSSLLFGGRGLIVPFYSVQVWLKLYVLCRLHLICCRTFNNQGKGTLAEIKSNELFARLKQNHNMVCLCCFMCCINMKI